MKKNRRNGTGWKNSPNKFVTVCLVLRRFTYILLILKESVVALYAGDRAIGSASSRHRLICKIGNGRLKVIVEFSRALERGRWERTARNGGGREGRQAEGSQLSRRRPSCVTSNCDEFKNVGGNLWREEGGGRRMGTALAKRNLSRVLSSHLHCYFDAFLIERGSLPFPPRVPPPPFTFWYSYFFEAYTILFYSISKFVFSLPPVFFRRSIER